VLAGLGERSTWLTAPMRLFLLTGILGGYTTFSAFGYETFALGREGALLRAGLNVSAHLLIGLVAVVVGHRIGTTVAG
jgi:CrcB protein